MFEIGDKLYYFVTGDEEGAMNTAVIETQSDVKYYEELVKGNCIEIFCIK